MKLEGTILIGAVNVEGCVEDVGLWSLILSIQHTRI